MMAVSGNSRDRAAIVVVVPGMSLNAETRRSNSYGLRREVCCGLRRPGRQGSGRPERVAAAAAGRRVGLRGATPRVAPRPHSAAHPLLVGILLDRFSMAFLMVVPRVVKARTQATAISAAATAYSESSRPVSSLMNLLIISMYLEVCLTLCEGRRGRRRAGLGWRAALSRTRAYGLTGILELRLLIAFLMVVPRVVKARTQATAISAAATAYSESSRPVSSRKNFFNICVCSF